MDNAPSEVYPVHGFMFYLNKLKSHTFGVAYLCLMFLNIILHYLMVIVLRMPHSLNSGAGCCNYFFNDWQHCLNVAILYSVMNKGLQGFHDDIGNSYFINKYILGIYGNIFYSCLFISKGALQTVC